MKRFYKSATAEPQDGGHGVLLDGRPVRTPAKALLVVPSLGLAEAIAGEWEAQGEEVVPSTMPLMAMACTALDLVSTERGRAIDELLDFAAHELLCYRAEDPEELAERQARVWQPLLDWLEAEHGSGLRVGGGLLHVEQPPAAMDALRQVVQRYDDFALAALATAVRACGSLVVGLALAGGRLSAEEAFAVSELEESFQIERWGEDPIAKERRDGIRRELSAVARFLASL